MDTPRFLPMVLALTLLASTTVPVPAAAQDPRLDLPTEARSLQWKWIQELDRDISRDSARYDLRPQDRRMVQEGFNRTVDAYQSNQWDATLRNILGLGPLPTYIYLDRQASTSDEDPTSIYIDHLDPIFQAAVEDSQALRTRINETAQSVETVEGLEYLYLAALRLAHGNENLRQYPQYRQLVQASGNQTAPQMYQSLVMMPMGAQRSFSMGQDLVNQSLAADAEGDSPRVDPSKLELAWRTMEPVVENQTGRNSQTRSLLNSMDTTEKEGEWLITTALGQVYIATARQAELGQALQQGHLNRSGLARMAAERLSAGTLVATMEEHGFPGILQRDVVRFGASTLGGGQAGANQLTGVVGSLDAIQASTDALVAVSNASAEQGQVAPQESGLTSLQMAVVAAGVGALVGAGAVAMFLKQRDVL